MAQYPHQRIRIIFTRADLVRHHLHQPPLLGVQLDGVGHAAVDDASIEGAVDVIAGPQLIGAPDRVVAGDHDDRDVLDGVVGVHGLEHLEAIHDRHVDVQQYQCDVPGFGLQGIHTFPAIFCFQNTVVALQDFGQDEAVHFRVIHKKNLRLLLHQFFLRGQRVFGEFHRDGILAALCLIHQPVCPANRILHRVGDGLHRSADAQ